MGRVLQQSKTWGLVVSGGTEIAVSFYYVWLQPSLPNWILQKFPVLEETEQSHPHHLLCRHLFQSLICRAEDQLIYPVLSLKTVLYLHEVIHTWEHVLSFSTERGRNLFSEPPASFCSVPYTWELLPRHICCWKEPSNLEGTNTGNQLSTWFYTEFSSEKKDICSLSAQHWTTLNTPPFIFNKTNTVPYYWNNGIFLSPLIINLSGCDFFIY